MTVLILVEPTTDVAGQGLVALARSLGEPVEAVLVGDGADTAVLAEALGAGGVSRLHVARHDLLAAYSPEAWSVVVAELIAKLRPTGVLASAGQRSAEVLLHTAARMGVPLATNCVRIEDVGAAEPTWRVTRTRCGGVLLEDAELVAAVPLATVAQGCEVSGSRTRTGGAADCEPVEFVPALSAEHARVRVVDRTALESGMSLATAPVVVSGGRGVGSAEGFAVLEELADALGGVVGCSRVATSNGWRPHRDQVGLTGTKVTPELYIACGISGATQHWVGCMDAAVILAVNTDPEAPMMQRATYSVVGDVHEVIPAVLAELRRRAEAGDDVPHPAGAASAG